MASSLQCPIVFRPSPSIRARGGGGGTRGILTHFRDRRRTYMCASSLSSSSLSSWCNPSSLVLSPLSLVSLDLDFDDSSSSLVGDVDASRERIFIASRPFLWNSVDVGGRMTVLNTSQGLLVHSPVALDDDLQQKIKQLSVDVAIIVAPNYEHLKFTKAWADAYPNAKVVGCPGVTPRLEGVRVDAELTSSEPPPTFWPAEVKYVVFDDVEVNPFTSKPFFNEVCLVAYDTLITADLFWNYPDSVPWKTRAWKFGMDQVYLPFYRELMVGSARRDALRAKVEQLGEFACIVPCHGDIVTSNGASVLRTHLNL